MYYMKKQLWNGQGYDHDNKNKCKYQGLIMPNYNQFGSYVTFN